MVYGIIDMAQVAPNRLRATCTQALELPFLLHRCWRRDRHLSSFQRELRMKKIAAAGFLIGLFGYVTVRVFGKLRPKRLPDRRSPAS